MQQIYFISDTHLGHKNIIKHCARPYGSVEEMDEHLIYRINRVVGAGDALYHLGDFGWSGADLASYRRRIWCRNVHLVRGNHDDRRAIRSAGFASINELLYLKINGQKLVLCHYPFASWKRNTIHLHGHCHGELAPKPYRLDVGVDALGINGPLALDQIVELAKASGEHGMY
mgnify:FL=1